MDITNILTPSITALITMILTWMFAREKRRRQIESLDLDNEIKSAKYYQKLLDDMSERLDNTISELRSLEAKHIDLIKQNQTLIECNQTLVLELQKFKQLNGKAKN